MTQLHPLIDDIKALPIKDYIRLRQDAFPEAKEDFSALLPYETMLVLSISYPKEEVAWPGRGFGLTARYTYGKDYHLVFKAIFKTLINDFNEQGINAIGFSDISPIDERFASFHSGLGFLGKNQFLIHPKFGTYHYIGTLLIDQPYKTTPNFKDSCGDCRICIDACPTNALTEDGFIKTRCTSYVTQSKIPLSARDIKPLKTKLFGCDICQKVCPKNTAIQPSNHDPFLDTTLNVINLEELLTTSNRKIMKQYHDKSFNFRGGLVLKRNALALLLNQRAWHTLPTIKTLAKDYEHVPWFKETADYIIKEMEKNQ